VENRLSLWKEDLAVVGAMALALLAGKLDFDSAEVTAKIEQTAYEKKADISPQDYVALTAPVGCGQWVAKRGANEHWRIYHVCADATRERQ
jgi:hypothetical protein